MQKLEMLIKTVDAHYDSRHQIQCYYLSCSLLNIARGTCNMMIVNETSNFNNKITIKFERAIMSGSIKVTTDFFNSLQTQLSIKNERPARLELIISDKLNINKNGILFLDKELISDIIGYKFFIPLL
tara:strand:- start:36 stop:416 length:381 start_codon:yes stop_codon:yes gene_type:complete